MLRSAPPAVAAAADAPEPLDDVVIQRGARALSAHLVPSVPLPRPPVQHSQNKFQLKSFSSALDSLPRFW